LPPPVAPRAPISDPGLRATAEAIARTITAPVDADASLEIPPPESAERTSNSRDPYIGTTFDHRYKIERLLGEGGMGFVYLARHKVIDKRVAVKVLRADLARDREILDRFVQEARSASSIGNPHIIDISDFGDLPDGSTYFVMEYLEGMSLTQLIDSRAEKGPLLIERICNVGMQMCDGLAAAHAAGIVHRDLKPDNIFLITRGPERDFVKILDFGIAKVSKAGNTKLTRAGAVFGTPHYMSPEQAAGAPIDHRTDVYSLGVMLYELTAGQVPFNADNFMGILTQHMYKAPVPIRALLPAPDCPPGLEAVILKCLSKKPEMRYGSMEELANDLERIKRGEVPVAVGEMMARSGGFNVPHDFFKPIQQAIVPATPPVPRKQWPRFVWIAGATAAVGLVTVIIVGGSIVGAGPKPPTVAETEIATAAPAPTAAPPAPGPKKSEVFLVWSPSTAVGLRDGVELKSPATVVVEDGKPATIEIQADGFEPTTVTLDGTEKAKQIDLKPIAKTAPRATPVRLPGGPTLQPQPRPNAKKPPPPKQGGDVVDPW
jgi:serine/threonine-protein kinase